MARKRLIIPVFIPFGGCPHQCVFCNQRRITGTTLLPTLDEVRATIDRHLSTWEIKRGNAGSERREVAFYGGSFTALPRDLQEGYLRTAHAYIEDGRIHTLRLSTRPDYISQDQIALLRSYRVETVELGVQSLSDEVLRLSGRGHTVEDTRRAVSILKDAGISIGMQLMPGLPGDSEDTIIDTARKTVELGPSFVRIYPTVVVKDTPLHEMYISGRYRPWPMDEMVEVCCEMVRIFNNAGIPIIRMGLHPSGELRRSLVAGPFHPSFRQLVEKRLADDEASKKRLHGMRP